jgi:hypothetical protein
VSVKDTFLSVRVETSSTPTATPVEISAGLLRAPPKQRAP